MMPGGHLASSVALGAVAYGVTGSMETAAGCIAGGFLIDFDHYLDYLLFEQQWRKPWPANFLRYYFSDSPKRLVLPLHSAEFMFVLLIILLVRPWPFLAGYWIGALMHLIFDILVNGDYLLKRPELFYVFAYRAANRFEAGKLLDFRANKTPGDSTAVFRQFFRCKPLNGVPRKDRLPASNVAAQPLGSDRPPTE